MVVEKDLTLSDVYLFGFRHATDSLGMFAGYATSFAAVSYTHLDVYKRQPQAGTPTSR